MMKKDDPGNRGRCWFGWQTPSALLASTGEQTSHRPASAGPANLTPARHVVLPVSNRPSTARHCRLRPTRKNGFGVTSPAKNNQTIDPSLFHCRRFATTRRLLISGLFFVSWCATEANHRARRWCRAMNMNRHDVWRAPNGLNVLCIHVPINPIMRIFRYHHRSQTG